MYLLYVDESGDVGHRAGSSRYFVLSGLVVHELRWLPTLDTIVDFRRHLRSKYTMKLREEIHASHLIQTPGELRRIERWRRLLLLRDVADFMATLPDVSIIHVLVDKAAHPPTYDVFENAWRALVQRFHNTISRKNFPGPQNADERGLLITDATDGEKLRRLVRRLRRFNPVPSRADIGGASRFIPLDTLVDDPVPRDSRHSLVLQLCDVAAYLLMQKVAPNKFFKKRAARNYFNRLGPVLCKVAGPRDPLGIVRL